MRGHLPLLPAPPRAGLLMHADYKRDERGLPPHFSWLHRDPANHSNTDMVKMVQTQKLDWKWKQLQGHDSLPQEAVSSDALGTAGGAHFPHVYFLESHCGRMVG